MIKPTFRTSEWIGLTRVLLCLVFLATGGMRLTMDPAELARMGDWTQGIVPAHLLGGAQILSGLSLLLPRHRTWGILTMTGSFLLLTYLLGSLLTHLTTGGHDWAIDALRIAGIGIVLRDLWRTTWFQHPTHT
ncbi:MAG: hypothetical protein RL318_392 [Fibrobacterota bacterium]|jgi:hypothetical protein